MAWEYFQQEHLEPLRQAVMVAEEVTFNFYKLSHRHWLKARYDISTLAHLRQEEISPHALALVAKYQAYPAGRLLNSLSFDFYRVCLQDHNILRTLARRRELGFFPLLCYIVTHELIHIVRFSKFEARFEADGRERLEEEGRVHRLTWQILAPLNFLDLGPVIRYYQEIWQGGCAYAHL